MRILGDKTHSCTCTPFQIIRYQKRISGPLLDRIDIHLDVPAVKVEKLTVNEGLKSENSKSIRKRIQIARDIQTKRFVKVKKTITIINNADMGSKDIRDFCKLSPESVSLLSLAVSKMNLSARSYHRVIKLAQTIADLAESSVIHSPHIAEALQYRPRANSLI